MITRMMAAVAVLFSILLLTLPRSDERSLSRIASASMLMCTKDFRASLADAIGSDEPTAAAFENTCPGLIAKLEMGEGGSMTIYAKEHALKMVLSPRLENGQVRWSCKGEPADAVTALCKE